MNDDNDENNNDDANNAFPVKIQHAHQMSTVVNSDINS